jgi:predicted site-specific integrase-resolvase
MKPMNAPELPGFFTEAEQAKRLGIGLATLRRWRRLGVGPKPDRCGRRHLYSHDADAKWLAEQRAEAERIARKRAPRRGAGPAGARP